MPPARSLRQRTVTNENDENATSTRLTRAKAAALSSADLNGGELKKPVQSKKATTTTSNTTQRRRAALSNISNVTKTDLVDAKDAKKAASKTGLTSKSTSHPGGVQKLSRSNTTRAALGVKDANKKAASTTEVKRPGSGSGVKRSSSQKSVKEDLNQNEEPPRKKLGVEKKKTEVIQQQIISENVTEVEVDVGGAKDLEAEGVMDLDTEDLDDPLMAAEYVVEIFDYLRDLEHETLPSPDYINHQPELEWKMRGILIDWLIEVHASFRLLPETLFLTVNIIDRFLSAEIVSLDRLQLVGVTAMFIASKYEEILSPHVANFSQVADDTFSDKEILDAERHVLATLNYNMSYPNPMNFLRRISKADNYDIETRTLGKYLMEISLLDHKFMAYKQSHVAAAAMYLARLILDRPEWDATLAHYSGYTEEEIQPVFLLMVDYLHRPVAHEAFFKKYASKKFLKASIVTRQWAKRYHSLYLNSELGDLAQS
ncbi:G2/M-specific cyclin NimE [Talaromyces stipitatus ATCC 10500]|uniref:G2/M-specific cyclin NimE n=1 Tax=Talaromyces stipitatus (strain ATCC 10500 / CBS 375.48 / QM 6759 / NRRL 1006) TaxID=441959 RepID=B8LWF9_TALSN|nr:G2/M-specific cyclin NimE [Talaromyces stipitatus ATCC 10500]EED24270.1 G2/M-specific cyclin NimE [Talaromyces stipitatus ATCC 10500]